MYGKVKRLRAAGKRLLDPEIVRSGFVQGEVRVFGLGGIIVASVSDPDSQVADPLIPLLYDARLVTMHGHGMLFKGEERPHGNSGPAYIQEWSVMIERQD